MGPSIPAFTAREIEVLQCITDGLTEKKAAAKTGVTYHTLRSRIRRLKVKIEDRYGFKAIENLELVLWCVAHGIVSLGRYESALGADRSDRVKSDHGADARD